MNVLSDRLVNLFGALAVGITDRIKKAAFDPTIPGGGETTAAIVVIGHATGLSIDELGRVLGLSHAGTVRLVGRRDSPICDPATKKRDFIRNP